MSDDYADSDGGVDKTELGVSRSEYSKFGGEAEGKAAALGLWMRERKNVGGRSHDSACRSMGPEDARASTCH